MTKAATGTTPMPAGAAAMIACLYEVTAPKPGNVHPGAAFSDAKYEDFQASARAICPIMGQAHSQGVGRTILNAVEATREAVGTNTNLGMILLFAPLAAVPADEYLSQGIQKVLATLTHEDTRLVYEAIRCSNAGGLGNSAEADISADPPPGLTLVEAMRLASDRDLIARQYTNNFADVFDGTAKFLSEGLAQGLSISQFIVHAHIRQLAEKPDSLIQRKCGP